MTPNPKEEETLKACPFCGGMNVSQESPTAYVMCEDCGARHYEPEAWNRRRTHAKDKECPRCGTPLEGGYCCECAYVAKPTAPAEKKKKAYSIEDHDAQDIEELKAALAESEKLVRIHADGHRGYAKLAGRFDVELQVAEAKLKSANAVVDAAGNVNEHFKHIVGATEEVSQFGAELLLELRAALSAHDNQQKQEPEPDSIEINPMAMPCDEQEPEEKHYIEEGMNK